MPRAFRRRSLSLIAALVLFVPGFAAAAPCPRNVLGTSRVLPVGTTGGLVVGLKTYPQTIDLADHEVVLTFDDGPWPATTPKILDALARECARATFFLIGRNAAAAPSLARREVAEGHTVGHHSYSHPGKTLRRLSDAAARADIERGFIADDEAAYGAAGTTPRVPFFRFPGFADTPDLDRWLGHRDIAVFGTDLWAADWLPMTAQSELTSVMERMERAGRGILLLHDVKASTAAMLPALLETLKQRGFKIVHLVPGAVPTPLREAPAGWTSETDTVLAHILPAPRPHAVKNAAGTGWLR